MEGAGAESGLRRTLGLGALSLYGIGVVLGAGIYSILGAAAGVAGDALWWAFLVGSAAAALTGLSYAELSTMFPQAGAEYVYLRAAWPRLGWLPGTLGWMLVGAQLATGAAVALAFGGYASRFVPLPAVATAALLLAAVTAINIVGIREASWANALFTAIETAGLVALVIVGLRDPGFATVAATPPHAGVMAAAGLVFFAYLGFEELANLAEEARDPGRDLPRALLISVAVSSVLYVLVAMAATALLDPDLLAASPAPLADAMRAGAPKLAGALGGIALFATANTALISVTAGSRLLFGMARGGDAPARLGRVWRSRGTPVAAVLAIGLGSAAFLPLGQAAAAGSVGSLLALAAFAAVNAALVRLRVTRPDAERPFRVPLAVGPAPLPTVAGLLVVLALMTQFGRSAYLIAAGTMVAGLLLQAPRRPVGTDRGRRG